MIVRWWTLPLLAWFLLDFTNPLMPGAVSFDLADSVEAVRTSVPGTEAPLASAEAPLPSVTGPDARPVRVALRPEHLVSAPPTPLPMPPRCCLAAEPPPGLDDD